LFDLDGTFADTAPDLTYAVNVMRAKRALPPISVDQSRPVTSHGARGLLGVGFAIGPSDVRYADMRREFLDIYEANLCRETHLFDGMAQLLEQLEARGLRWGIVTNKAERLAKPLIERLAVAGRCACIIGGDTTAHMKPHPAPLLSACEALNITPAYCIYVGDDQRDVEAARAAGMRSVAVRYGYLNGGNPEEWGADAVVDCPQDVLRLL
jgi:N-acetyl-D-muramate 6-phosphate phosphatase